MIEVLVLAVALEISKEHSRWGSSRVGLLDFRNLLMCGMVSQGELQLPKLRLPRSTSILEYGPVHPTSRDSGLE